MILNLLAVARREDEGEEGENSSCRDVDKGVVYPACLIRRANRERGARGVKLARWSGTRGRDSRLARRANPPRVCGATGGRTLQMARLGAAARHKWRPSFGRPNRTILIVLLTFFW